MNIPPILLFALITQSSALLAQHEIDDEAVFLKKNSSLDISISNGLLEITEHNLSEKAFYRNFEKHTRESVYYSDFDPVVELEAVTLIPSGSGFKKMKVPTIDTNDIMQRGIFYGGYKRRDFVFSALAPGSIGRLEYVKRITDVHLLSPFYFHDDIKVRSAAFSVTFPRNVVLGYKLFGDPNNSIAFKEVVNGNRITYSWTLTNVPAYHPEKDAPSMSYTAPHIVLFVESYESKGNKLQVLSDVGDLYQWYNYLLNKMPSDNNSSLKELVVSLTKNVNSDTEKTKIVFQWVQRNIKYIAFEDGLAGFVPRSAADVYNKRYGDCKDMANLLKEMLGICGIKAYHTWIGTRAKPYSYNDVPTTIVNNHMICSVKSAEGYVFLDATNPFLSYGKPSSMIQGKEALIGLAQDKFEVVKVPIVNRVENFRHDSLTVQLNTDGLHGTFASHLSGYKKDDIEINHLKAELDNDHENIRDFFTIGGNNISIEKLSVAGLSNQNVPAKVYFNFFQPGYYKKVGDNIYINLNLNKTLPGDKLDITKRKQSLELDYCYEDQSVTIFTIPEGYTASFIPKNTIKEWPEFGVNIAYRIADNIITVERIIYSNVLYLDSSKFQQWNEFVQQLGTIYQQSVILTKIK